MAEPLTLRQMRERIRILKLGRSTKYQVTHNLVDIGEPHPNDKKFSNELLDIAIEETISDLNVRCGIGGSHTPAEHAVTAQTADGPLVFSLSGAFDPREGDVNEVNRVWWNDGSGNTPLVNRLGRDLDANLIDYYSIAPGTPRWWWTDRYAMWISPAPNVDGKVLALTGNALHRPMSDDDTITHLPGDLYPVVLDGAGLRICVSQPDDKVMASAARLLAPQYESGIPKIQMVLGLLNGAGTTGDNIEQYRTRRGSR